MIKDKHIDVVVSTFDGMSCGHIALDKAGFTVGKYYSSEIKPHAIEVANNNYPQDTEYRLGDITKIKGNDLPKVDLYIGGSPCQDFSGANKERLGDKGVKSGLFYEYTRLLNECKPTYFLLENVRMKKEHQKIITDLLGVEPIVINSELVAPHLRHRLYWTNIKGIEQPKDKGLLLNEILTSGWSPRSKSRTVLASESRPLTTPRRMVHRYFSTGFTTLIFKNEQHYKDIKAHYDLHFKGNSAKVINTLSEGMDLSLYEGVRYMNTEEREFCQTVPVGYTQGLSQDDASCLLGDGWTIDVIAHILSYLK